MNYVKVVKRGVVKAYAVLPKPAPHQRRQRRLPVSQLLQPEDGVARVHRVYQRRRLHMQPYQPPQRPLVHKQKRRLRQLNRPLFFAGVKKALKKNQLILPKLHGHLAVTQQFKAAYMKVTCGNTAVNELVQLSYRKVRRRRRLLQLRLTPQKVVLKELPT